MAPWEAQNEGDDNIKMDLQEVGCGDMDRIGIAQDRGSEEPVRLSRRTLLHEVSK